MKSKLILILSFIYITGFAQISGTVKDNKGISVPFVNIYVENTYQGTTTNDVGKFEISVKGKENYTLVFQSMGYKTQKININTSKKELNITLEEDSYSLKEVVLNANENPALKIIKKAIENRKKNSKMTAKFKADFYSKGLIKLKNAPKKFLGEEIPDFNGALDSTGSGIIYLSETFSKIEFEKPNNLKEIVVASKVAGNDNGYSFNSARSTNFDLYENTTNLGLPIISPIAENALGYYKYSLEGTSYEGPHLINKIKVTAKRDSEPVYDGYIYIIEDSWAIFATDLSVKGYRIRNEFLDAYNIKQNYTYNSENKIWSKNLQSLEFKFGAFGISMEGKFSYIYNNYEFVNQFDKKNFTREIQKIEPLANKQSDDFWKTQRPITLTDEEFKDYIKKDSVQTLRKSQKYLDSIDIKKNKFKIADILMGYSHSNTYKEKFFRYNGLIKLVHFNTVQGWNIKTGFNYNISNDEKRTFKSFYSTVQYGFKDRTFRPIIGYAQRFNNLNKATLGFSLGNKVSQFNEQNPILNIVNSISSLAFKDNYMKLYDKNFARINYSQELNNGIFGNFLAEYAQRKNIFNKDFQSWSKKDKAYTSNNPLFPEDETALIFENHNLFKLNLNFRFNFGQKYISRPDGKYNLGNSKYPKLNLAIEQGLLGTKNEYNYTRVSSLISYEKQLGNKGEIEINLKAGKFFNAKNITFADYKHFNGNETHVSNGDYRNSFHLLPYYSHSTNDAYLEIHAEHNDNGFIMNKIPLLNKLKSSLVLGYHNISIPNKSPYQEFTIGLDNLGIGKFKFLRLDYVQSYNNGIKTDGFTFGINLLDAFTE